MTQKPMAKVWHQADRGGWFYMLDMNSPVGPFDNWVIALDKLRDEAKIKYPDVDLLKEDRITGEAPVSD
jgi:hypothetical protein